MTDIEAAGFFTGSGKLRSREEVDQVDRQIAQNNSETNESSPSSSDAFVEQTRESFQNVRARVNTQVADIASSLNERRDDLKAARANTNEQIEVAKELETFIELEQTDTPEFENTVRRFQDLRSKRNEIANRIEQNNQERPRSRQVRLGNQERGESIQINRVEFTRAREINDESLSSLKGIREEIRSLREERSSLRNQIGETRALIGEVRQIAKNVRAEIGQIENSIENISVAEDAVAEITRTIRQNTNAEVLRATNEARSQEPAINPHKGLTPERVTQLLQSG